MSERLNLVAFYIEKASIILVDANGAEYQCNAPDELWAALFAIRSDPSLPAAATATPQTVVDPGVAVGYEGEEEEHSNPEAYEMVAEQVGSTVGRMYGPVAGRLCEGMVRNGGPNIVRFLRRISR